MRVHVNGRLPLIKTSVIEYPNGDEVIATLVYEKLEKHCVHCGRLDHEMRDCLEAKHQKKALLAEQGALQQTADDTINKEDRMQPTRSYAGGPRRHSPRREDRYRPYARNDQPRRANYPNSRAADRQNSRNEKQTRDDLPAERRDQSHYRRRDDRSPSRRSVPPRNVHETYSGASHTAIPYGGKSRSGNPACEGMELPPSPPRAALSLEQHNPHRSWSRERRSNCIPQLDLDTARGDVNEVMRQYSSCVDPSESAARKERIMIAEAQGRLEESAALMVRASRARLENATTPTIHSPPSRETPERIPISDRLGHMPSIQTVNTSTRVPIMARLGPLLDEVNISDTELTETLPQVMKRKPGRPPGRKQVNASPAQGTTSKKRQVLQAKPPLNRRKASVEQTKASKTTKGKRKTLYLPGIGLNKGIA
ncbi:hypothetical protein HID58_016261 [Brassica napus]|uniref:Zinc knuckle CX2CX4HX4C domain-containing protein n=3 Tax=Brassica TaxID=3705 RepID=A0ABQ8DME3_BRANA|nr:hypothetical protein HID58_016261 [Brassica napus]